MPVIIVSFVLFSFDSFLLVIFRLSKSNFVYASKCVFCTNHEYMLNFRFVNNYASNSAAFVPLAVYVRSTLKMWCATKTIVDCLIVIYSSIARTRFKCIEYTTTNYLLAQCNVCNVFLAVLLSWFGLVQHRNSNEKKNRIQIKNASNKTKTNTKNVEMTQRFSRLK